VTAATEPAPAQAPRTTSRRALGFIFAAVFLDLLGIGILIPVIPFLVRQFTPSALAVGLLALSYALAQFIATCTRYAQLALGKWSLRCAGLYSS